MSFMRSADVYILLVSTGLEQRILPLVGGLLILLVLLLVWCLALVL